VPEGPTSIAAFRPPPQKPPVGVGRGGGFGREPNPNVISSAPTLSTDDECRAKLQRLFEMDFGQRFDDLVTAAARANIAFYPVDVGGLKLDVRGQSTLRTLADANDGMPIVNRNDIRAAFRSLSDRLSAYYLLGYYSNNETRDGRFRKIEVRVGKDKVSARLGYFAYPLVTPAVVAPSPSAVPVAEALEQLGRLDSDDEVFATAVSRADGIDVVVELAERPFGAGRWSSGASVAIRLTNAEGADVRSEARIDPGRRSVLLHVLPRQPGSQWRARAEVTGAGAPAETPWVRAVADDGGVLGPLSVYRGAVSARVAVQPAAEMRFNRNERIHLEVPIDDALAADRGARVLDRRGQALPVPAAVGVQTKDGHATMSVDVLAGGLASGDYLIEVTGGARAQVQRRLLAFRVVR
jgi:hypothetical protein